MLYRVDTPTHSDLYLYESGQKIFLERYPVVNFSFATATPVTHINGVTNISGAEYSEMQGVTTLANGDIVPRRTSALANVTNTSANDEQVTDAATASATAASAPRTATASTENSLENSSSISTNQTGGTEASGQSIINYALPPGAYDYSIQYTVGTNSNFIVGSSANIGPLGGTRTFFAPGQHQFTDSNAFNEWSRREYPELSIIHRAQEGAEFTPIDTPNSFSSTFTLDAFQANTFRPFAYLSKTGTHRYVGLHHLDASSQQQTDYFVIDASLTAQKTTWGHQATPQVNANDQQRSLLTHSKDDFLLPTTNALFSRVHVPAQRYNIQSDSVVTEISASSPGLSSLISSQIPEASAVLWVAALPNEARALDVGGEGVYFSVTQY